MTATTQIPAPSRPALRDAPRRRRRRRKADVGSADVAPAELAAALVSRRTLEDCEREIARLVGARNAVAFPTARGALVAALVALGRPDPVAVAGYATSAVPNAVVSAGARPVFVDVDERGVVPAGGWPAAGAVITQDTYGFPGPIPRDRLVIRDATHGAQLLWEDPGVAVAVAGAHESKSISAGQGGVAVTDDADLAARMRSWRDAAPAYAPGAGRHWTTTALSLVRGRLRYRGLPSRPLMHALWALSPQRMAQQTQAELAGEGVDPSLLGRPLALVARMIASQLRRLPDVAERRQRIVARYDAAAGVDRTPLALVRYPMVVDDLEAFEGQMARAGWELDQRWLERPLLPDPIPQRPFGFDPGAVPNARRLAGHVACLPTHGLVREADADELIELALAAGARPLA